MQLATALILSIQMGITVISGAQPSNPTVIDSGFFDGGELEVAGERILEAIGEDPGRQLTAAEWQSLRDAARLARADACRAAASGPLAAARCDVTVLVTRSDAPQPGVPPVTIADLARFAPLVGELVVEPDGWGVVGTPTNFYATAESHTMDGELFDAAIQVRWTPSSYVFDYGDGTVEETEASGTAWRGVDESWTETATSHTYSTRDDVDASVTVIFTAEVNAGSGWFAVPGTLPVDAPAVGVKVFEVDTVLTDGDCVENPAAAGCG